MIQIGNDKIKGAFLGKDELKYIYIGKTCVYYKETPSTGETSGIKVCFAVVDNISTYKDRIYDTVFSKFDNSWYILNDFNEYEKYGVYQEVNSLDKAKAITRDIYASINPNANGSWNKTQESDEFVGYESNGNFSSRGDYDLMQIDLTTGFTEFSIYMKAKGSRQRDVYALAYNIDATKPTRVNPYGGKDSTRKYKYDDNNTALSSYTKVDYTGIDSASTHTIYIGFGAREPSLSKNNKGEVLIPNMPHVKIDGTTRYDGKLVENSTDKHEYEFTNGSWVDKGEITTTESVKTYPVVYEKYDDPAEYLKFSTLEEANSYKGCLYPNEICTINDENYYAVRKKDDGSFSWEECPLSWKATYPSGKTVYVTGDTTIDQGDIKTDVVDVEIGNGVTSISERAFYLNYTSLTSVMISNSVTSIGERAFGVCSSLSSVTIPNSVTSIGNRAFDDCSSLSSITLGNSVTSIGEGAFSDCEKLTNVTIPVSVTHLGAAFYGCDSLTNIIIPSSVTSISNGTFGSCTSLARIKVDDGNTTYDSRNDCNAIIETKSNTLIAGCKSTVIPNSVTSIGKKAFDGLPSTDITIPNSVKSIGEYAFDGSSLTGITIPNSVTSIDSFAFSYCKSLKNVTIPSSITYITACLFRSCGSLSSITIPTSVATIGGDAFLGCGSLSSIMYQGTRSQWNSIKKGDYMSYSPFRDNYANITVHCTDGNFKMTDDEGSI